jgi:hypothetical protein
MNCTLRTACLLLATTFAAVPLVGCKVTIEPLVRYEGSAVEQSVPYTAGKAIHIIGDNGQIEVVPGNSDQVVVTFSPFTMDEDGEAGEERAKSEITERLTLSATDGTEILIEADKGDGSSSYLGADIQVALPTTFNGGFEVDQGNGEVDVNLTGTTPTSTDVLNDGAGGVKVIGARGKLDVTNHAGDVEVDVASWGAAGENGILDLGTADLIFTIPSDANGTLSVTANDGNGLITETGIPATWASAGEGGAKSYTMNAGTGAHVEVTTGLGDVSIVAR